MLQVIEMIHFMVIWPVLFNIENSTLAIRLFHSLGELSVKYKPLFQRIGLKWPRDAQCIVYR